MVQSHLVRCIEQQLRARKLPLALELWDGSAVAADGNPRVTLQIRTPQALSILAEPTMGKLARSYVEQQIDVSGDPRDVMDLADTLSTPPVGTRNETAGVREAPKHSRELDRKSIQHHY